MPDNFIEVDYTRFELVKTRMIIINHNLSMEVTYTDEEGKTIIRTFLVGQEN